MCATQSITGVNCHRLGRTGEVVLMNARYDVGGVGK